VTVISLSYHYKNPTQRIDLLQHGYHLHHLIKMHNLLKDVSLLNITYWKMCPFWHHCLCTIKFIIWKRHQNKHYNYHNYNKYVNALGNWYEIGLIIRYIHTFHLERIIYYCFRSKEPFFSSYIMARTSYILMRWCRWYPCCTKSIRWVGFL
jgi:hypothetical protein